MRNSVVVMHNPVNQTIHFCSTELQGQDRWIKFEGNTDELFGKVEQLMVDNGIAHNVTSVQFVRQCGIVIEYQVVYNEIVRGGGEDQNAYTLRLPELDNEMKFDSLTSALEAVTGYFGFSEHAESDRLIENLESFFKMAAKATKESQSRPALFIAKSLDGKKSIGWHFVNSAVKVGDRFHFDHGVGINNNLDGFYMLVA